MHEEQISSGRYRARLSGSISIRNDSRYTRRRFPTTSNRARAAHVRVADPAIGKFIRIDDIPSSLEWSSRRFSSRMRKLRVCAAMLNHGRVLYRVNQRAK